MTILSAVGRVVATGLKLFAWVHEVADLPHQSLMAIDYGLGAGAILVETRRGHLLLDCFDRRLGLGDAGFESGDSSLTGAGDLLLLPRLGVDAFLFLVIL